MRKYLIAILAAATILGSTAAYADMTDGYSRVSAKYGENAAKYITKIEDYQAENVNLIWCAGEDASVYTETNIRTQPSAEVERVTTIGTNSKVKVWGFTDNGWCRVWVKTADNNDYYGYIKGDLLNPADWNQAPAQDQAQDQTQEQSQEQQTQPDTQAQTTTVSGEEGL